LHCFYFQKLICSEANSEVSMNSVDMHPTPPSAEPDEQISPSSRRSRSPSSQPTRSQSPRSQSHSERKSQSESGSSSSSSSSTEDSDNNSLENGYNDDCNLNKQLVEKCPKQNDQDVKESQSGAVEEKRKSFTSLDMFAEELDMFAETISVCLALISFPGSAAFSHYGLVELEY